MKAILTMQKVYEPLNMVMNGRYAVLYKKLDPEVQADVLANMARLIAEEKASGYADKGNYGHLHDIDFKRTQTLCQGGKMCDFCFVKHRKGEVWERSKSV